MTAQALFPERGMAAAANFGDRQGSVPQCQAEQHDPPVNPITFTGVLEMAFYGVFLDPQYDGDVFVGLASRGPQQAFTLAIGQPRRRWSGSRAAGPPDQARLLERPEDTLRGIECFVRAVEGGSNGFAPQQIISQHSYGAVSGRNFYLKLLSLFQSDALKKRQPLCGADSIASLSDACTNSTEGFSANSNIKRFDSGVLINTLSFSINF